MDLSSLTMGYLAGQDTPSDNVDPTLLLGPGGRP